MVNIQSTIFNHWYLGLHALVAELLVLLNVYETTPKWHGFLMIRLSASMARMKQRTAACDELSRVEYRISNRRISKDGVAALCLFN